MKLKNSNLDKTQIVMKLKNSNLDKTQIVTNLKKSNCDKTKNMKRNNSKAQNVTTQIVTKFENSN